VGVPGLGKQTIMIILILPFPPSVNGYWRNINGKTLISAKGRAYKKAVSFRGIYGKTVGKTLEVNNQNIAEGTKAEEPFTDPASGVDFVYVKGGCYQMGDTFGDGDGDEKPVHEVCVDGFFMGKY